MFGSGISFSGLGSGIDSSSLISRLVQLEGLRKAQLESKQDIARGKQTALGKLEGLVKDLRDEARSLSTSSGFLQLAGSASREGVISFDVGSTAAQGTHSIEVQQLAAYDRWAFDAVADSEVDLATGAGQVVSFTVGGTTHTVAIQQDASTLSEIAQAINQEAGDDVSASVINVGTAADPSWKLVLASDESGEAGRIGGITSTVGGLTIDATEPAVGSDVPASANNLTVGTNAIALVDGLLVERDSNEFDGVIPAVTFTAQSADVGFPVDLSIEPDRDAIRSKLYDFVEAYNAVMKFVNEQSTFKEDKGTSGALFGDSTMSLVRSKLRTALFDVNIQTVTDDTEGYSTLGLVGIDVENDGTLSIDDSKLDEKITGNVAAFADLFADDDGNGTDTGIATNLVYAIDSVIDRGTGPNGEALKSLFGAKNESLANIISELDRRIEEEDYRLDKYEEALKLKYANLENLMASLNSQSSALGAIYS
jgi:flagellar hook-associated protein 2